MWTPPKTLTIAFFWVKLRSHINVVLGEELGDEVKKRSNVDVVWFRTIAQPTACVAFDASRQRTATSGNMNALVHAVSSTSTKLTDTRLETRAALAKNASTKTFDASTWTSDAQTSDDATAFLRARDWSVFALARAASKCWANVTREPAIAKSLVASRTALRPALSCCANASIDD